MTAARHDSVVEFYSDNFSAVDGVLGALLEMVGPVDGLAVLDLACGHGRATRELARRFDAVVCNFALSDIDDLDGALGTVRAALKPGGVFAFSMLHPCFAGGGDVDGSWAADARHHDEGWWRARGERSGLRRQVGANHRMLST